jgi:hypothetical protein
MCITHGIKHNFETLLDIKYHNTKYIKAQIIIYEHLYNGTC